MLQYLAVVGFFIVALGIFAGGLALSNYKKKGDNSGCCGCDGGCSTSNSDCAEDGTGASCYNSKSRFVKEYVRTHS